MLLRPALDPVCALQTLGPQGSHSVQGNSGGGCFCVLEKRKKIAPLKASFHFLKLTFAHERAFKAKLLGWNQL